HDDEHRRLVESYADPGGNRGGRDAREKAEGDVLVGVKAEKVASEGDLPVELRADRSPNEGRDARSDPTNEGLERRPSLAPLEGLDPHGATRAESPFELVRRRDERVAGES